VRITPLQETGASCEIIIEPTTETVQEIAFGVWEHTFNFQIYLIIRKLFNDMAQHNKALSEFVNVIEEMLHLDEFRRFEIDKGKNRYVAISNVQQVDYGRFTGGDLYFAVISWVARAIAPKRYYV